MLFRAVCPACGGTGGSLRSFTFSDNVEQIIEQMKENARKQCYLCKGKTTVLANTVWEDDPNKPDNRELGPGC